MKKIAFLLCCFTVSYLCAQDIGQITQGLSVLEKGLWPNKTCEVCWENPSPTDATQRAWVRDAVRSTWERESEFRFTGWGTCNANSRGIRILIANEHPRAKGLGAQLDGKKDGVVLNFNWSGFPSGLSNEDCIRAVAVHEFGHALGFAHEQNRKDAPLNCQNDAQGTDGDWWVTGYDANSIMNYCNPAWNNNGFLSELDKFGIKFLYGGGGYLTDPIIYTINDQKTLLWYKHIGHANGTPEWAASVGQRVGDGWDFKQVLNDGDGHSYAIKENGDLFWYNHNGFHEGTYRWAQASGAKIGTGWLNDTRGVFAAGGGVLYLIKNNGDLLWYKHLGYLDGKATWDASSGKKVGNGWNNFYAVFSGGNGVFYLIDKNGDLFWYKHAGSSTGANQWFGGMSNKVGNGWKTKIQIFSTGWGNIYCVNPDGTLQYYCHEGFNNGRAIWKSSSSNVVGSGWLRANIIGMGAINPNLIITPVDIPVTPPKLNNPEAVPTPDMSEYTNPVERENSAKRQLIQTKANQLRWNDFKEYVMEAGRIQGALYTNGAIFVDKNQAFETHGYIFSKWKSLGGYNTLGRPITDESTCPDGIGKFNHFRAKDGSLSSIYWTPKTRASYIHGAIRDHWAAEGWERGVSGYPTNDEKVSNNRSFQRMQDFEKRQIYWSPRTGCKTEKYPTIDPGTNTIPANN